MIDHAKYVNEYRKAGIKVITPYDSNIRYVELGSFKIKFFELVHNVDNFGAWIFEKSIGKVVYITDTQYIKYKFQGLNHILVEANYSKDLLAQNEDNSEKKSHVLSGHMELQAALDFISTNNNAGLRNVILCHLSQDNANPEQFKHRAEKVVNCPVHLAQKGLEIEVGLPF